MLPLTYFFLLPRPADFTSVSIPSAEDTREEEEVHNPGYMPLPTDEIAAPEVAEVLVSKVGVSLSLQDKWRLVKPMLPKYMLPLCEYHPSRLTSAMIYGCLSVAVYLVCHVYQGVLTTSTLVHADVNPYSLSIPLIRYVIRQNGQNQNDQC